jgi:hypothetical protein
MKRQIFFYFYFKIQNDRANIMMRTGVVVYIQARACVVRFLFRYRSVINHKKKWECG